MRYNTHCLKSKVLYVQFNMQGPHEGPDGSRRGPHDYASSSGDVSYDFNLIPVYSRVRIPIVFRLMS